jgi:hypothetical protein
MESLFGWIRKWSAGHQTLLRKRSQDRPRQRHNAVRTFEQCNHKRDLDLAVRRHGHWIGALRDRRFRGRAWQPPPELHRRWSADLSDHRDGHISPKLWRSAMVVRLPRLPGSERTSTGALCLPAVRTASVRKPGLPSAELPVSEGQPEPNPVH